MPTARGINDRDWVGEFVTDDDIPVYHRIEGK